MRSMVDGIENGAKGDCGAVLSLLDVAAREPLGLSNMSTLTIWRDSTVTKVTYGYFFINSGRRGALHTNLD